MKKNPLVKVTAVGLNFEGFMGYAAHPGGQEPPDRNGESRFLRTFVVLDALRELVDSDVGSGAVVAVYQAKRDRCALTLRSDAVVKDNRGVALDLNVHEDVGKRQEARSHVARLGEWFSYFIGLGERLSKQLER